MKPIEIRVGICGCLSLYHGQLHQRTMRLGGASFIITEVALPNEKYHTASIKKHRCHFFIDVFEGVKESRAESVFLSRIELKKSSSGRSERLKDEVYSGWRKKDGAALSPPGMARLIRKRIAGMRFRDRARWLTSMAFAT